MRHVVNRRSFLSAALAGASLAMAVKLLAAPRAAKNRKALIGLPVEETLRKMKDAGFDGLEFDIRKASPEMIAEAPKTAAKAGIQIHSILRGWMDFERRQQPLASPWSVQTVHRIVRKPVGPGLIRCGQPW